MELRHLRYFVTVAEERSFRRASLRLHISQPPLSRLIKQLEEQVGAQLFDRTTTGVELTAAGEVFLEGANKALRITSDAVERSRRAAKGDFGHLEVAYYGSVIFGTIPHLIGAYRDAQPRVTVRLSHMTKDWQIRALRDGWLDIGFARYYRDEPDIASEVVVSEPVVLAVPSTHPLANRTVVPMSALRDECMIVYPAASRPSFADEVMLFCDQAGFTPRIVQETEDPMACLALVSGGVGIALVPISTVNIRLPRVAFLKVTDPEPTSSLCCVYRRNDQRPLLSGFLAVVRALNLNALNNNAFEEQSRLVELGHDSRGRRKANI
ncbi:LysR family transcriptional regulator [Achromobacter pulmonis]|uniref:LysR family transcriptional regulator n=1 Tax=Achromobacter pulmonis TaxID=1389932 RepID=A0A2N8K8F8_9BURK|nr:MULTISPECIES: LysR family transcriptional regulator [Achromobacter]PND29738.1 LysR family transcriptional regulator [Achromobacter pulmonis]QTX01596.1 LysR family transcriptional regulator CcdR [Achromobacter sp.]